MTETPHSPPGQPQQPYSPPRPTNDERSLAMLAHSASVIAWIVSAGWLSFLGPLGMWLWQKDRSAFVRQASAGAFNFNIGMVVMTVVGWIMIFTILLAPIGLILIVLAAVLQVAVHGFGVYYAWKGEQFSYPFRTRILAE